MQPLRAGLLLLVLSTWASQGTAADLPRWRVLRDQANQALNANDCVAARRMLQQLQPLMPGNPRNLYNLAACNARLGNQRAALAGLQTLAHMGLVYDLGADADFAVLSGAAEFRAILARMTANRAPQTRARLEFRIGERDLLPESLAFDDATGRWFISSVRQAKIITADGRDFARTEWSVFALGIDSRRRLLWATIAQVPQCAACARSDDARSALLAFDLDTGAQRRRIESPLPGILGDMLVGAGGDVFVTESLHGAVLRLPAEATRFERLDDGAGFLSPQTPALSSDGSILYVPDYVRGLAAIRLVDHRLRWLRASPQLTLTGIDGLYRVHDDFVAIQNGTSPIRILEIAANLGSQQVLEQRWQGFGEPTHGVIVNGRFYFLANSGWELYDQQGTKRTGSDAVTSTVWSLPLIAATIGK